MKNKLALKITIIFFFIYGFASTIGSMFVITWGRKTLFKNTILFMENFPVDWLSLLTGGSNLYGNYFILFSHLLQILSWSLIVYLVSYTIIKSIQLVINAISLVGHRMRK
jgi:hypothetical protein